MKKIGILIIIALGIFGFGAMQAFAQSSLYTLNSCQGTACTTLTANLPPDSTSIPPSTDVSLNMSVTDTQFGEPPCTGSNQIYHAVWHGIAGSSSNYEYLASGSGTYFEYDFNSQAVGTQNSYYGVFYCYSKQLDPATLDSALGTLNTQGKVWQTPKFNLATNQIGSGNITPVNGGTTVVPNGPTTVTPNGGTTVVPNSPTLCTGANPDPNYCLKNPLPEDELTQTFLLIIKGFLAIVGIWAVIFIIIGGFQMVMAAGNEEGILKAKKTITWAILGLVIALLSFSIIAIVENLLQANVPATTSSSSYQQSQIPKYL